MKNASPALKTCSSPSTVKMMLPSSKKMNSCTGYSATYAVARFMSIEDLLWLVYKSNSELTMQKKK